MAITLLGLDFEATGANPTPVAGDPELSAPIQIGIYVPHADLQIEYLIGGWDWKEYTWNPRAEEIHGYTQKEIDAAEPVWKVDARIVSQLFDVVGGRMFNLTIGWNVAGYDRAFVTRHFPLLNRLLSYRTIDLNAVLFSKISKEDQYMAIKKDAKEYADEKMAEMGFEARRHHALTDSIAAVFEYEYLRTI